MKTTILAKLETNTLQKLTPVSIDRSLQFMPPGPHTINATKDGKPQQIKVVVNEATAQRLQQHLETFLKSAEAGAEDLPFLDFNHDDKEASGHVKRFFWGGADPLTGGVRAEIEWTSLGMERIKGREYRRFSPQFNLNERGEVVGAPLNMGGLVNRAAFKTIQPVKAKDGEQSTATDHSFLKLCREYAEEKSVDIARAIAHFQSEKPEEYSEYVKWLADQPGNPLSENRAMKAFEAMKAAGFDARYAAERVQAAFPSDYRAMFGWDQQATTPGEDPFVVQAKALAEKKQISFSAAASEIAASVPGSYEGYCARLANPENVEELGQTSFEVRARQVASERNVDVVQAMRIVATEQPELYTAYNRSVIASEPAAEIEQVPERTLTEFEVAAKQVERERGLGFLDAVTVVAQERPHLYEAYNRSLTAKG